MAKRKSDIVDEKVVDVPASEAETQPLKNGVVVLITPLYAVVKTEKEGNVSIGRVNLDSNIKIGDTVFF
jgi:hypothetical protein